MKIQIKIEVYSSGTTIFSISELLISIRKRTQKIKYYSYEVSSLYQIFRDEFDPKFIRKISPPLSTAIKANKKLKTLIDDYSDIDPIFKFGGLF